MKTFIVDNSHSTVKIFVILSVDQLVRTVIVSQLEISHVSNGPRAKTNTDVVDLLKWL